MTDRGVSITVNYVMSIMIATMLMTGLLMAVGDTLENRRESSARAELDVIGQRVAADLATADRLAQAGGENVVVEASLSRTVAGLRYTIDVNATDDGSELTLSTDTLEVESTIQFDNATAVTNTSVAGGDIEIVLVDEELEVRHR